MIVVAALVLPVLALLLWFDAFDEFYEFSRAHEDWELDELVGLLFLLGIGAVLFSYRRLIGLSSEIEHRIAAENEASRLARQGSGPAGDGGRDRQIAASAV